MKRVLDLGGDRLEVGTGYGCCQADSDIDIAVYGG